MLRPARLMLRLLTLLLLVQWSFGPTHTAGGDPAAQSTMIRASQGAPIALLIAEHGARVHSALDHDGPDHDIAAHDPAQHGGPMHPAAGHSGGMAGREPAPHPGGHDASGHHGPGYEGPEHDGAGHEQGGDRQKPGHRMSASCQFCLNPAGGDLPDSPVLPLPRAVAFRATLLLDAPFSVPPPPRIYSSRAPPILPRA